MTAQEDTTDPDLVIDLRDRLLPVGDQGRRGTCVAFAVTAVHEADRGAGTDDVDLEDLAEEVLFWGAKEVDADRNDGTRFTSANQALQRWGQPAEALWPYDGARDHRAATYVPPANAIEPQHCHRATLRPLGTDVATLRYELAAGQPVALGIPVWDGFRRADAEPLPTPNPSEIYPTRHAVVAVGHDPARGAVLIRNSWGSAWGDDGHLWVDAGLLSLATAAWAIDEGSAEAPLVHLAGNEVFT